MKDKYNQIDDYLDGKLSPEEAEKFGEELGKNTDLLEKYNLIKSLRLAYKEPKQIDFLNKVENAHQAYVSTQSEVNGQGWNQFYTRRYLLFGLAAVIILGLFIIKVIFNNNMTDKALFEKYYAAFDQPVTYRNMGEAATDLNRAMQLFKSGLYGEAAEAFKKADSTFSDFTGFFLGMCYMEMEQYSLAEKYFKSNAGHGEMQQESQWYLALAYLAEGNRKETKETLQSIINNPDHYYHQQAKNLLDDLGD